MSSTVTIVTVLLIAFIVVVAGALIALLIPRLISHIRLRRRAEHDHRVARGTQHLKQLERPLAKLERDIGVIQSRIRATERQIEKVKATRKADLQRALCTYLVNHRLTEVDGIGPQLQGRVVRACYRGNLRDLRSADRVHGVGPTRQAAIMRWVRSYEQALPRLLEQSFPGRQKIMAKAEDKLSSLHEQLEKSRRALVRKQALHAPASRTVDKLRSVGPSRFRKALAKRGTDGPVPAWYLEGVYPAWESPPDWFVSLLSEYGG